MKTVEILKDTVADGDPVKKGQTVKVSDAGAAVLIRLGKAALSVGKGKPSTTPEAENADSGDSRGSDKPKTSKAGKP